MRIPFFVLVLTGLLAGLALGLPIAGVLNALANGFGNIIGKLGLIITLGIILGGLLEYTRCTLVMADAILHLVGRQRTATAMSITGFIVGLPIFCDSGFIVLSGLNRKITARTGASLAFMTTSLATGLYSIHCLIPPHPGAAAAAGLIGVPFGKLVPAGIAVAIPAALAGHCWARFAGRNRKTAAEETDPPDEQTVQHPPSTIAAFIPVVIPIIAIALGPAPIALLAGIVLTIIIGGRGGQTSLLSSRIAGKLLWDSIKKAFDILLIIGAGGAFGAVLNKAGIGVTISQHLPIAQMGLLLPFIITAILKIAQGSSTVAIITASGIVHPLLTTLGLSAGDGPLLAILAMGAGSMTFSHMNDAYFWVVSRFSGLDMRTMLRVYSIATLLMGVTAFLTVYIISLL